MDRKYKTNPNTPEKLEWLYTKRWSPATERVNEWMFPYLLPLLGGKDKNILEVGCGFGKTLSIISGLNHTYKLTGIDISPTAIKQAKKYYKAMKFICMDFEHSNYVDEFDFIICSQTLEHVDNPKIVIENMKKALKNDGTLFITVPWPKSSLDNGVKCHYWRFYPKDFQDLLNNCTVKQDKTRMIVVWHK